MAPSMAHLLPCALFVMAVCCDMATSHTIHGLLRFAVPNQNHTKNNEIQEELTAATLPVVQKSRVRFRFDQAADNTNTHRRTAKSAEQTHMEYLYRKLAGRRHSPPSAGSPTCAVTSYRSRLLSVWSASDALCTSFSWLLPEDSHSTVCFAEMWFSVDHFRDLITASSHQGLLDDTARLQIVAGSYSTSVKALETDWASMNSNKWIVIEASQELRERAANMGDAMVCVRSGDASSPSDHPLQVSTRALNHHHLHPDALSDRSPFSVGGVSKAVSKTTLADFILDNSAKLRRGRGQIRGAPATTAARSATGRRRRNAENQTDTTQPISSTYENGVEVIAETPALPPSDRCQRRSLVIELPELFDEIEVVRPTRLDIFDCTGNCDFGEPVSSHAVLMSLVRQREVLSGQQMSSTCCVPAKFENEVLFLLIRNGTDTKTESISSPIVTTCGCS